MKNGFKSCFTKLLDVMKNINQGFEETQEGGPRETKYCTRKDV